MQVCSDPRVGRPMSADQQAPPFDVDYVDRVAQLRAEHEARR